MTTRQAGTGEGNSDSAIKDLKEQVAHSCRILYDLGLMTYLGHVTVRIPGTDRLLLGFNRYTYGNTTADDILTFDMDAKKVDGPDVLLPYETFIYTETLKIRPDMNSVIHLHMPVSLAFGVARREILPLYIHHSEVLRFGLPTVDNPLLASTVDRGQSIARALKEALAIAKEKSALNQPNSFSMGIWKTPKLARIANPASRIRPPANRTGLRRGE